MIKKTKKRTYRGCGDDGGEIRVHHSDVDDDGASLGRPPIPQVPIRDQHSQAVLPHLIQATLKVKGLPQEKPCDISARCMGEDKVIVQVAGPWGT